MSSGYIVLASVLIFMISLSSIVHRLWLLKLSGLFAVPIYIGTIVSLLLNPKAGFDLFTDFVFPLISSAWLGYFSNPFITETWYERIIGSIVGISVFIHPFVLWAYWQQEMDAQRAFPRRLRVRCADLAYRLENTWLQLRDNFPVFLSKGFSLPLMLLFVVGSGALLCRYVFPDPIRPKIENISRTYNPLSNQASVLDHLNQLLLSGRYDEVLSSTKQISSDNNGFMYQIKLRTLLSCYLLYINGGCAGESTEKIADELKLLSSSNEVSANDVTKSTISSIMFIAKIALKTHNAEEYNSQRANFIESCGLLGAKTCDYDRFARDMNYAFALTIEPDKYAQITSKERRDEDERTAKGEQKNKAANASWQTAMEHAAYGRQLTLFATGALSLLSIAVWYFMPQRREAARLRREERKRLRAATPRPPRGAVPVQVATRDGAPTIIYIQQRGGWFGQWVQNLHGLLKLTYVLGSFAALWGLWNWKTDVSAWAVNQARDLGAQVGHAVGSGIDSNIPPWIKALLEKVK